MDKPSFTPGKWNVHKQIRSFAICDESGHPVANVPFTPIIEERKNADARLIAAAPQMFAAMWSLIAELDVYRDSLAETSGAAYPALVVEITKARAALSRAGEGV